MKIKNIFHNLANVLDKKSYKNLGIFFISMLFSVVLETISVGAVIPVMSVILDPNIISKHIWLNDMKIKHLHW